MSHVAESYVYRSTDGGPSYVGRSPRGSFVLVARRGQTLTDEQVEELGLEDLKDHTDYEAVLNAAAEAGAPMTMLNEAGAVIVVGGSEE